jgi:hypothetical protein
VAEDFTMSRYLSAGSHFFMPSRRSRESFFSATSMEEMKDADQILSAALNALLVLGFVALMLAFTYPDAVTSFLDAVKNKP